MLLHNESLFLPSKQMYMLPSGEAYSNAKKEFLLRQCPHYSTSNVNEKWTFLISQFSKSLPTFRAAERPNNLSTDQIKQRLDAFKTKRNDTSSSKYNLSIVQCNRYFEDFLFLYTTQDSRFKLSDVSKKTLLTSIIRAMGVCEVGINTEFYAVLQEVQRDTDWVRNELSKARAECIRELHKRYNTQHGISDAINVHVYDHFVRMANTHHFGIEQKETILDTYAGSMRTELLEACFNAHHKELFQQYEIEAPCTLMTYLASEINAVLGPNPWDNNSELNRDDIAALLQVLRMHFGDDANPHELIVLEYPEFKTDSLGNFVLDKYKNKITDVSSCISRLKPRHEFDDMIRQWVIQKMLKEGYYIEVKQLLDNSNLCRELTLRNNLAWEDFRTTYDVITTKQFDAIRDNTQHMMVIQAYPDLILSKLRDYPELVSLLASTQPDVKEQVLTLFASILRQEVDALPNEERLRDLVSGLVDFFDGDADYLKRLPPKLLEHPDIGKALVAKDGLLWVNLGATLKNDVDIYQMAQKQNPDVVCYKLNHQDKRKRVAQRLALLPIGLRADLGFYLNDERVLCYLGQLDAYRILLNHVDISVDDFLKYAPMLSPDMLTKAIQYRKQHKLKPLPIVGQSQRTLDMLLKFQSEIHVELGPNVFYNEPCKIRKLAEAARIKQADNHHPLVYLAKNKNWIQGFSQYQAYQIGEGRRTLHFRACLLALSKALLYVLAVFVCVKAFLFLYLGVDLNLQSFYACASERGFGFVFLVDFLANSITQLLVFAVWELLCQGFGHLVQAQDYVIQGVEAYLYSYSHEPETHKDWQEQIKIVIARLRLRDEPASQQKADILNQLKTKMWNESDLDNHPAYVNKRYDIEYQQKNYRVSFAEVAACRREVDAQFSLDKTMGAILTFGLFHVPTSSERLLLPITQKAQYGVIPQLG